MPLVMDHVWVDHYPVAYQQHGRGEAVVLVHGSMGDYRTWSAQVFYQSDPLNIIKLFELVAVVTVELAVSSPVDWLIWNT